MQDSKSIFASKGVWGGVIALVAAVLGVFGVVLSPADQAQAVDLLTELAALWDRLFIIFGATLAIYGRVAASKKVG